MVLIADSGSTKTDWALFDSDSPSWRHFPPRDLFSTIGLNPHLIDDATLHATLQTVQQHFTLAISQIQFYGAGCGTSHSQQRILSALHQTFPTVPATVATDLLGACHATLGTSSGIVGILGTGSNSCYYDGSDIVSCPPSLGYLLGDEGSGNHIGRCLIKDFFSGCMPAELASVFSCQYHISHDAVLDALYHQPQPNRYLASLASFAIQYSSTPYIQTLLANVFNAYFQHQVALLATPTRQLALVGGIAHQFAAQIEACANQNGYSIIQIRKALIEPPIKE